VWVRGGGALVFEKNERMMERPWRTIALQISRVYRTVLIQTVMVVAGIIPMYLMAIERLDILITAGS